MLLSQFPLTFQETQSSMTCLIAEVVTILVLIGIVFVIVCEMLRGTIS